MKTHMGYANVITDKVVAKNLDGPCSGRARDPGFLCAVQI
jgi:hypothetical protein